MHGTQTLPNKAAGEVALLEPGTVDFDNEGWWVAGEHKYIPKRKGVYLVGTSFVATTVLEAGKLVDIGPAKNGALVGGAAFRFIGQGGGIGAEGGYAVIVEMNGTTDALTAIGNTTQAAGAGTTTLYSVAVGGT